MRTVTMLCIATVIVMFSACETFKEKNQGMIRYEVSFPFLENSILKNVFPEEMTLHFKESLVKGEIRSLGGIVTLGFIGNGEEKTFQQMLKNYQEFYVIRMDEAGIQKLLADQPSVRLEETDRKEIVAGYECDVTIAHFIIDSVPPIELLHTTELDVENPNWFSHYKEIDGVLLGYEIEQYGMRMKLHAKEIVLKEIPDAIFEVPDYYQPISLEEMQGQFEGLLTDFAE